MKKYFLLALMFVLCTSILIAVEIHVYHGDSIQQAVNNAASNDVIIIHPFDVSPFYYAENVNLDSFNGNYLTITGEDPYNWNTVEETHVRYSDPELPVFYTTDVNILSDITINILGIKFYVGMCGIEIIDTINHDFNLNVGYCIFRSVSEPIITHNHTPLFVENCIFHGGSRGVWSTYDWDGISQTDYLLNITGCEFADLTWHNVCSDWPAKIDKCTFVYYSYYTQPVCLYTRGLLSSSIIAGDWNNGYTILGNNHDFLTVRYSNIVGGVPEHPNIINEIGNIDADPLFVDPLNDDYQLTQLSPCIDAGDPISPLDPDNTVADMGCYYFHHEYDIKRFEEGIQWVSFPYLAQQGTYNGEIFEQAYWNPITQTQGLLQLTSGGDPTINDFDIMYGNRVLEANIDYIPLTSVFEDYGFDNMLLRHEGYKVKVTDGGDPTVLIIDGDRLGSYTLDMPDLENFWLGYYIPYPQNIEDAFGEDFENVNKIWAEDWYYDALYIQRGGDPNQLSSNSTKDKTMEYGKMYIVQMYHDVTSFSWNGSTTAEEPTRKTAPENFSYTEKADYEVIDVVSIPSNITEIGVFEDDICVGAIAVEDSSEQILVYSDNANRDPIPFTFEIVTGRGFSTPTKDYLVLNQMTGEFEPSVIISGRQGYSAIKFGEQAEPENIISRPVLNGNYPNPFNPTTTISFSLPAEQDIELAIFNIKGQKVKTLYSGTADIGEHNVVWEGRDKNNKQVSSGIYFYKLTTNNKELTRKMLMMK